MKLSRLLLASAAIAVAGTASAADLLTPVPITDGQLFDFEGMYFGGTLGAAWNGSTAGTVGVVVGTNFAITDGIIAGAEFQGDAYFNGGGVIAYDALGLGRVGGFVGDNTLAYVSAGGGLAGGSAVYAIGGGVEMAMTDQLSIRGEVQGLGAWGSTPSVGKANVGLMWHIN
jgi:outer membrane immunogenic protein